MTLKLPVKESNRLHMVIASEIKEGLDLTLIADATKSQSTGESNPAVKVTQMLEYVKEIKDFTKRIPIELLSDTNTNFKEKQLEVIKKTNPAPNEFSTWLRTVDDIKTLAETLEDDEWSDYGEFNPDLTKENKKIEAILPVNPTRQLRGIIEILLLKVLYPILPKMSTKNPIPSVRRIWILGFIFLKVAR